MHSAVANALAFQSTLPVRGATTQFEAIALTYQISIHAPRAGSDRAALPARPGEWDFNPRSPCGERQF